MRHKQRMQVLRHVSALRTDCFVRTSVLMHPDSLMCVRAICYTLAEIGILVRERKVVRKISEFTIQPRNAFPQLVMLIGAALPLFGSLPHSVATTASQPSTIRGRQETPRAAVQGAQTHAGPFCFSVPQPPSVYHSINAATFTAGSLRALSRSLQRSRDTAESGGCSTAYRCAHVAFLAVSQDGGSAR